MLPLSSLGPEQLGGGINLVDIGASGDAPAYWERLAGLTNLIGFDPNEAECRRLDGKESGFLSRRFLPYAIAGESGPSTLYRTRSPYCWSLLQPNLEWLRRFAFSDLFEVGGTETVTAVTLDGIDELRDVDVDAMKLDTQGLELPILRAAERVVSGCILIETETGFTDNYLGESTFDQVAHHMRAKGFGLFGIHANHSIPRRNGLSGEARNEEILWCEAVWLRDFRREPSKAAGRISREKALKALCIYAHHGCISFGLESAGRFVESGALTSQEYGDLASSASSWKLRSAEGALSANRLLRGMLALIPRRYYASILAHMSELSGVRHPLSRRRS